MRHDNSLPFLCSEPSRVSAYDDGCALIDYRPSCAYTSVGRAPHILSHEYPRSVMLQLCDRQGSPLHSVGKYSTCQAPTPQRKRKCRHYPRILTWQTTVAGLNCSAHGRTEYNRHWRMRRQRKWNSRTIFRAPGAAPTICSGPANKCEVVLHAVRFSAISQVSPANHVSAVRP